MTQFEESKMPFPVKRTAPCTPGGSVTAEAALAIPLFLFAVLCLVYILEMHAVRTTVRMAAHAAAKQMAQDMAVSESLGLALFKNRLVQAAGSGRLDGSILSGGSGGIYCGNTRVSQNGQIEVCVEYELELPFPKFAVDPIRCREEFLIKGWTGYESGGAGNAGSGTEMVYITETASVYHADPQCTHLDLSIRFVKTGDPGTLKNKDNERLHACEKCGGIPSLSGYYITDHGDKYHTSLGCSGLKRTVYAVSREEAQGKKGCSKCVQQ